MKIQCEITKLYQICGTTNKNKNKTKTKQKTKLAKIIDEMLELNSYIDVPPTLRKTFLSISRLPEQLEG